MIPRFPFTVLHESSRKANSIPEPRRCRVLSPLTTPAGVGVSCFEAATAADIASPFSLLTAIIKFLLIMRYVDRCHVNNWTKLQNEFKNYTCQGSFGKFGLWFDFKWPSPLLSHSWVSICSGVLDEKQWELQSLSFLCEIISYKRNNLMIYITHLICYSIQPKHVIILSS